MTARGAASEPARHDAIVARLTEHLTPQKRAELDRCALSLTSALGGVGGVADAIVLAMYGGGKDSSFMVAAVRYVQLLLRRQHGRTFMLRIVTNRHPGMPQAVMQNIDRAYAALGVYDDPTAELLSVCGNEVMPFDAATPLPETLRRRDRLDVLMNGHRCGAAARPTFCNRCNLNMENAVALAVGHGRPADVVITGDSLAEQRRYLAWVRHIARGLNGPTADRRHGLRAFLGDLAAIERRLSADVFGDLPGEAESRRLCVDRLPRDPLFFTLYEDTSYGAGDHWGLITEFLGFQFDDVAFSFTESDCGNPGLMAHLHALRHERVLGLSYEEGLREYFEFATELMRRKEFPTQLIDVVTRRYADPESVAAMRQRMAAYGEAAYQLTEEQLVCMTFAPLAGAGRNLAAYLAAEHPGLMGSEALVRATLSGDVDAASVPDLDERLTAMTGLDAAHRRTLYASPLVDVRTGGATGDLISVILKRDPHKAVIARRTANGTTTRELLSGR